MTIDTSTGQVTWSVQASDTGSHNVTIRVDDGRGGFDTQSFTIDVSSAAPAEIRGTKFDDLNGSGMRDTGEPGLPGWTIYIDQNQNDHRDLGERFTTTDASGNYSFTNLVASTYTVAEEFQMGWVQTAPATHTYQVTVQAGQVVAQVDFGNQESTTAPVNHPPHIVSSCAHYRERWPGLPL